MQKCESCKLEFEVILIDAFGRKNRTPMTLMAFCPFCGTNREPSKPSKTINLGEKLCLIFGSEIESKKEIYPEDVRSTCKDIWEHPTKYCDSLKEDKSEEAYYRFLKFLWVRYPDGSEKQLARIANDD